MRWFDNTALFVSFFFSLFFIWTKCIKRKEFSFPGSGKRGTIIGNVVSARNARGETGARLGRCRNPSITRQQIITREREGRQTGSPNADRHLLPFTVTREQKRSYIRNNTLIRTTVLNFLFLSHYHVELSP